MSGYPVNINQGFKTSHPQANFFAPGGQGDNIYQLLPAVRNGKLTLIGSVSKGGNGIIDFQTGEVLYDFSDFGGGATPRLGFDSYCACTEWNGWYLFGGWVKTPALLQATNTHVNKYAYVVGSRDLKTWSVIHSQKSTDVEGPTTWTREVSDIVGTPTGVYIMRGDGTGTGQGLYKWDGTFTGGVANTVLVSATDSPGKGVVYNDQLCFTLYSSVQMRRLDLSGFTTSSYGDYTGVTSRGGNSRSPQTDIAPCVGVLNDCIIRGDKDGYFIGSAAAGANSVFVPLGVAPHPLTASYRAVGWRTKMIQAAGGIITAVNSDNEAGFDINPSWLVYIGVGGQVKLLDVAAHFGAICVMGDRILYGKSSCTHQGTFTNVRQSSPTLASMLIDDVLRAPPPPLYEHGRHAAFTPITSGGAGVLGGYPTHGYKSGKLLVVSNTSGNLTIVGYSPQRTNLNTLGSVRVLSTVAMTANISQEIDIASFLNGDVLGIKFSTGTDIEWRIQMLPY